MGIWKYLKSNSSSLFFHFKEEQSSAGLNGLIFLFQNKRLFKQICKGRSVLCLQLIIRLFYVVRLSFVSSHSQHWGGSGPSWVSHAWVSWSDLGKYDLRIKNEGSRRKKKKKVTRRQETEQKELEISSAWMQLWLLSFYFVLSVEGSSSVLSFSLWQNLFSMFFPLVVYREIMPFDIVPIVKISETEHNTVDNAEAMPLRMLREVQKNQHIYLQWVTVPST